MCWIIIYTCLIPVILLFPVGYNNCWLFSATRMYKIHSFKLPSKIMQTQYTILQRFYTWHPQLDVPCTHVTMNFEPLCKRHHMARKTRKLSKSIWKVPSAYFPPRTSKRQNHKKWHKLPNCRRNSCTIWTIYNTINSTWKSNSI